jgi:hypothetical protein
MTDEELEQFEDMVYAVRDAPYEDAWDRYEELESFVNAMLAKREGGS